MKRVAFVAGAALAACTFSNSLSTTNNPDIDAAIDAPCDAPTLSCADGVTLRASCAGTADVTSTCPWGCLDNAPGARCGALVPGGGGVRAADLDPTNLADVSVTGSIDGSAGEINGNAAGSLGVAHRIGSNNISIFRFKSLTITGPLDLRGDRPIALVASGDITINGIIDARGDCNDGGAGRIAGPGGGNGATEGTGASPAGTSNAGGGGDDTPNRGAGGGGHGATGGSGGGNTHAGGSAISDPQISILVGGGGGGGAKTSAGGGGGGALQLVSNKSIMIAAGAGIHAGGCRGDGGDGNSDAGGGGGGAGGALLLEAPRITLAATAALAVNGGAGGNRTGGDGSAGRLDRTRATAPTGGGRGGAGSNFTGEAGTGAGMNQTNGGGGGAVGRIRFHTGTGAATELTKTGAVLSPDTTDGAMTTTTHERANVQ